MKNILSIILLCFSIPIFFLFQNCGSKGGSVSDFGNSGSKFASTSNSGLSSNNSNGSSSIITGPGTGTGTSTTVGDGTNTGTVGGGVVTVEPINFKTGDPFIYNILPSTKRSEMVARMMDDSSAGPYLEYSEAKAIAISSNGAGYVAFGRPKQTHNTLTPQQIANRTALMVCNALTNRPCLLIASGNKFVIDASSLSDSSKYKRPLDDFLANLGNDIPFMEGNYEANANLAFTNLSSKAEYMYISLDGRYGVGQSNQSATLAETTAKQNCEAIAGIQPCLLYRSNYFGVNQQLSTLIYEPYYNWDLNRFGK